MTLNKKSILKYIVIRFHFTNYIALDFIRTCIKCGPTTVQIAIRCARGLAAFKHLKATSPPLQSALTASPPPVVLFALPLFHQGTLLLAKS